MIEQGLENEVRELSSYKNLNLLANRVGYKEWWPYFDGEYDLDYVITKIKQNTKKLSLKTNYLV
ncbi:MAG: hypothetical protein R2852_02065 [Bacteroidia bacterium]